MNFGIVVSDFNSDITHGMLEIVLDYAKQANIDTHVCHVPGTFDMPIIVDRLLAKQDIDGIVTLGAIITGETKHDEIIAQSTANFLTQLAIKYSKPVSLGIAGPCMTIPQARARIKPVAQRAIVATKLLCEELGRLEN